ncbi:unnamed protein product [Prorocentrum cordatum]|uniref:C3H1-type domain-containing protein n=1 Tax=Prorocentrum cordatum TaxID=2364126 RepID=A0ABN9UMI4_9DINO|nr:unnamed protein product [Polarella glacialis]
MPGTGLRRKGNDAFTAQLLNKTRLCSFYESGTCTRGEHCGFAHGRDALRKAPDFSFTQRCRSFAETGTCSQGNVCTFAHAPGQLRRWRHTERNRNGSGRGSVECAPQECEVQPQLQQQPHRARSAAARAASRPQDVPAPVGAQCERQRHPQAPRAPAGRGAEAAGRGARRSLALQPSAPQLSAASTQAQHLEALAGGRTPLRSGAAMFVPRPQGGAEEAAQVSALLHALDVLPRSGGAEAARQVCGQVGEKPVCRTEGVADLGELQAKASLPFVCLPPRDPLEICRGITESSDAFDVESVCSVVTADNEIHCGRAKEGSSPQLAATVSRTFLHFFVPGGGSSLGSRRRASSAH